MFEIKARVYDLQVTHDEMHKIKWGLYRDALFQAEYMQEYRGSNETSEQLLTELVNNVKSISMHEWITRVLEHGHMGDHDRLIKDIHTILEMKEKLNVSRKKSSSTDI